MSIFGAFLLRIFAHSIYFCRLVEELIHWRSMLLLDRNQSIYLFKVNNKNIRKRCETILTIKIPEWLHWCRSDVFIVNFKHISDRFLLLYCCYYWHWTSTCLLVWLVMQISSSARKIMFKVNNNDTREIRENFQLILVMIFVKYLREKYSDNFSLRFSFIIYQYYLQSMWNGVI